MKSRLWVYSGDRPSNGAKELAAQDGFLRLRDDRFHKVKSQDIIVNWGVRRNWNWPEATRFNHPKAIQLASDKLEAFKEMCWPHKHVQLVEWTASQEIAQLWANNDKTVVVRNKLTGHSGDGIIIIGPGQLVPSAPLYTKYVFKIREFRVHVVAGKVIDTQKKIRDPDQEPTNWKIRSHANGFIYVRNNIANSSERNELAIAAINALGLDFGAVDIVEDKAGKFYVLEVNTAPGLEGKTVELYANAFREIADGG